MGVTLRIDDSNWVAEALPTGLAAAGCPVNASGGRMASAQHLSFSVGVINHQGENNADALAVPQRRLRIDSSRAPRRNERRDDCRSREQPDGEQKRQRISRSHADQQTR